MAIGVPESICGFCGSVCSPGNDCHKCGGRNHKFKGEDVIESGLNAVAAQVEQSWLPGDYPEDMRDDRAQFRHAHIHATKALGKIAALIDHQDHQRMDDAEAVGLRNELPKLLGDLVRCTAKMAECACDQPITLSAAYIARARLLAARWGH